MLQELLGFIGTYWDLSKIAWICPELSGFVGNCLELHENLWNREGRGKREEARRKPSGIIWNYRDLSGFVGI